MRAAEFERDLEAWIDGELPPERAAAMRAAADASPDLARRAASERRFHERVKKAMASDAAIDDAAIRAMLAKARGENRAAGRLFRVPRGAWRALAAGVVVAVAGMWWFCVPPFECAYMQALEAATHDAAAAKPGADADALAMKFRLPAAIDGAVAARPAAATRLDVFIRHLDGVRLDYVKPDAVTAFHVVACDSPGFHPSIRRRLDRDGVRWWTCDLDGNCTWAFQAEGTDVVYSVTGPEKIDDEVYAAAKDLRRCVRQ